MVRYQASNSIMLNQMLNIFYMVINDFVSSLGTGVTSFKIAKEILQKSRDINFGVLMSSVDQHLY